MRRDHLATLSSSAVKSCVSADDRVGKGCPVECSCGAWVPTYQSQCPQCSRIVRPELYEERLAIHRSSFEARLNAYEARVGGISESRYSIVDSGGAGDLVNPVSLYPRDDFPEEAGLEEIVESISEDMTMLGLDPTLSLDDLLEILERHRIGLNLWTSGRRARASRYRAQLYDLVQNRNVHIVTSEAPEAWAAIASALVAAWLQVHIEMEELRLEA